MPADGVPVTALEQAKVTPSERVLLRFLIESYPRAVSRDTLTDRLFSGSLGTMSGHSQTHVYLSRMRKALAAYGWTISGAKGGRGNTGFYRLEPKP